MDVKLGLSARGKQIEDVPEKCLEVTFCTLLFAQYYQGDQIKGVETWLFGKQRSDKNAYKVLLTQPERLSTSAE